MTEPGGLGDKGSFSVDISQAPGAIRELESALEQLRDIQRDAFALGHVDPRARDQVSRDAADLLGMTANGGPKSLSQALTDGIDELTRMIESLRSGFENYRRGDADVRSQLEQSS